MKRSTLWAICFILQCLVIVAGAKFANCAEFEKAIQGRALTFPKDHGKHPNFETEWWYFTGNLISRHRK